VVQIGRTGSADTATAVLDVAERLVQQRGFNGFSYADVAAELGVTKASLHYHFPGKAQLGEALISRYAARFATALTDIDHATGTPVEKLRSYGDLYRSVLVDRRMCLCGMLAAEYDTLPDALRQAVIAFFDRNEEWLARLLEEGKTRGVLRFAGDASQAARTIVASLEGAMLVSRPYGDTRVLDSVTERILREFSS
jgi:TetR/AcrR family transcriptional regulator, transcriptional repressor for nem operon